MSPFSLPRGFTTLIILFACSYPMATHCQSTEEDWAASQPLQWINDTCVYVDQLGDHNASTKATTVALPVTTTVYVTMSTSHAIQPPQEFNEILMSYHYTYISVVTRIEQIPPATPTAWPYEVTHTMKIDRFDATHTTYGNGYPGEGEMPCPQTKIETTLMDYSYRSTLVHFKSEPTHIPAGVTAHTAKEVVACSEDTEEFEPDPECEARGDDTACMGQCPEVDGELVCTKEWISMNNMPKAIADKPGDHRWAVGQYGRACWGGKSLGYRLLNKPCLKGDHWVGCSPGKGVDQDWRPVNHDNTGLD